MQIIGYINTNRNHKRYWLSFDLLAHPYYHLVCVGSPYYGTVANVQCGGALTLIPLHCPILLWEEWATSLYLGLPYHQRFTLSLSYVRYTTACRNSTVTWTTLSGPALYLIYYILSFLTYISLTKARVHICI